MRFVWLFFVVLIVLACEEKTREPIIHENEAMSTPPVTGTSLVILGTIQDAGSPHIACKKECCALLFENPDPARQVVSLGVIDPQNRKTFLFEATPDMATQVKNLQQLSNSVKELPDGILLTHAHIGHYTGLMYLGKEAINASGVAVYAMPRMKTFLEENGPWSQLVSHNNISISELQNLAEIELTSNLKVIPFTVPHRDEFSETVGYKITGPSKTALFIPDIDKWEKWETSIITAISEVDYAFLDATFFDAEEINSRDISEIPHPLITESMKKFQDLPTSEKKKVYFIHFNHTNPVLNPNSKVRMTITANGYNIATINSVLKL